MFDDKVARCHATYQEPFKRDGRCVKCIQQTWDYHHSPLAVQQINNNEAVTLTNISIKMPDMPCKLSI